MIEDDQSKEKKGSEKGLPYLTMDKPFPDDFTSILTGVPNREELVKNIINPYVARLSKQTWKKSGLYKYMHG